MRLMRRKHFCAAHRLDRLPPDHKCYRLHGHNYTVQIEVEGEPAKATGFVVDFAVIDTVWDTVIAPMLDHQYLNDVEGLEVPSAENIAVWLYRMIGLALPRLSAIEVWETPNGGARYEG